MKNKNYILIIILALIAIFAFTFVNKKDAVESTETKILPQKTTKEGFQAGISDTSIKQEANETQTTDTKESTENIFLKIITGEEVIEAKTSEGKSFYEVLSDLKTNGKINFEAKEYSGIGFFVTEINGLVSGDGNNLLYYINDIEASVGVSQYIPNDGDVIEWKLK